MNIVRNAGVHCLQKLGVFLASVRSKFLNGMRLFHLNRNKKSMEMKKSLKIRKISVEQLLDCLEQVYENGYNLVDIVVEQGEESDRIGFFVIDHPYIDKEIGLNDIICYGEDSR